MTKDDILLLQGEKCSEVQRLTFERLQEEITVYNFEVESLHNYFVSDCNVLVHNTGTCGGPNGRYEKAPYHNKGNNIKSAAPKNGQAALDNSVQIKSTSPRRLGYAEKELVVLDQTSPGVFHGHVREFNQLTNLMKNIARKVFGVGK